MINTRITIPSSYFDAEQATCNLLNLYQEDLHEISKNDLTLIFNKLNYALSNIKNRLKFNPDLCINLLESIIGENEKFSLQISQMTAQKNHIQEADQISVIDNLISDAKILRNYIDKNIIPDQSILDKDAKTKLLEISSNICFNTVTSMVGFLKDFVNNEAKNQKKILDIKEVRNYFANSRTTPIIPYPQNINKRSI